MDILQKLKPYPLIRDTNNMDNKDVYGKVILKELTILEDSTIVKCRIEISLINTYMIKYDTEVAEENYVKDDIQPYFYEFYIDDYMDTEVFLKLFENYKVNGLYFPPYEEIRLLSIMTNSELYAQLIGVPLDLPDEPALFRKFRFIEYGESHDENAMLLNGSLLFSASPIVKYGATLKIVDVPASEIEKIEKQILSNFKSDKSLICYDRKNELDLIVNKELDTLVNYATTANVSIFNVGQGNNVYVDCDIDGLFFDIGFTKECNTKWTKSINEAVLNIAKITPKMIILSHWDLDHILGVTIANNSIYDAVWIAPNFNEVYSRVPLSAQRLCAFLIYKHTKIFLLDKSFNNKKVISINDRFTLFKGEARSSCGINRMNNYGLILKLSYGNSILLTGDCEYKTIPDDVFNTEYKYIIVPHHGSKMSKPRFLCCSKEGEAIICVGNNRYGHPDKQHKRELKALGYVVNETKRFNNPDYMYNIRL